MIKEKKTLIINKSSKVETLKFRSLDEMHKWRIKNNIVNNMYNNALEINNSYVANNATGKSNDWIDIMMKKHNSEWINLYGYNKVIYECVNTQYNTRFYVIDMFDKKKVLFTEDLLMNRFSELSNYESEGIIVNMIMKNKKNHENIGVIVDEHTVSKREYIPTVSSIMNYLNIDKRLLEVGHLNHNSAHVVQTGMTVDQFDGLRAKLSMIGIVGTIVDLNTLAVIKDYEVYLYTRQKNILE
jgi:hypothetical protein